MALLELDADRAARPEIWPDCCARCANPGVELVPIPRKYSKDVAGLAVPLCARHTDDWSVVRFRNRIGAVVILLVMAATGLVVWELQPKFAGPINQNNLSRAVTAFFIGFLSILPSGALLAWWAKTPIRVLSRNERKLTLAGVCRRFAAAAEISSMPPPLPVVAGAARFEVWSYNPVRACPPATAAKAIGLSGSVGAIFGWVVGMAATAIGEATAGWARNDWRFLGLAAAVVVVYVIPIVGFRLLFSRIGIFLIGLPVVAVVLSVILLRILGLPLRHGFAVVLAAGPLVLLYMLVVSQLVWRWQIRSSATAVLIGAAGPLAFLAVVFLIGDFTPGLHEAAYFLGTLTLISFPIAAWTLARTPYCQACTAWLDCRRVGALARSAAEIRPALASGQVISLAGLTASDSTAPIGGVELKIHSCPNCRQEGTVVLELFDCRGTGKEGRTRTLIRVGRWQYPGPALEVIEKLFPSLAVSEAFGPTGEAQGRS